MRPDHAAAHNGRGIALSGLRRWEEALAAHEQALALRSDFADAHIGRGNALYALTRYTDALACFEAAIALVPNVAMYHSNRGNALRALNRPAEALAAHDKAIELSPDYAVAYNNRGNVAWALDRPEEALAAHDKAIALSPGFADPHNNRGNALCDLHRHAEALESYATAIAIRPDYADAHVNRSFCLLQTGRFEEGWAEYEWRKKLNPPIAARSFAQPLWLGETSVAGKTIFVHSEQGYGDTIQFCRYAKLLEARGASVVLQVRPSLHRLISRLASGVRVLTTAERPAAFDFHCPMMSLPLAFGTTLGSIPSGSRYLEADAEGLAAWSARLGPRAKPRVGVVWSGSSGNKGDHKRSLTLAMVSALFSADRDWVCVQKEVGSEEKSLLRQCDVPFFCDELNDFADTAALIELLDLVITVDTSVAHLAGALGKPVWIMLPYAPDWRWLLDRNNSPWYPSVRLFRQPRIGAWPDVIAAVDRELRSRDW